MSIFKLIIFALVLAAVGASTGRAAQPDRDRWGAGYIPNVELVTQDGKKVRFYDDVVKGRIVIISFIFTNCRDICPLITARMSQVYDLLGSDAGRKFRFVSISIDPENDTPLRLKQHADAFRADDKWQFLTGDRPNIDLVRSRLGERSRKPTEHKGDILLRNDLTGEWSRDSAFTDIRVIAHNIRSMDPEWRSQPTAIAAMSVDVPRDGLPTAPGHALFVKACASCHTFGGGDLAGPDLAGITVRRTAPWIVSFLQNPSATRASGDPYIAELLARFPNVRMPNLRLSSDDAGDLLAYLKIRSYVAASQPSQPIGKHLHQSVAPGQGHEHHHGNH